MLQKLPAMTLDLLHMSTSQLLAYLTPVDATQTCGLENPNSVLSSVTSTNSCETGSYTGKKQSAMKAFEGALDSIADRRKTNPLQVFVDAICHAAPMEEITELNSVQYHNLRL
jgi:hypothetical protein